MHYIKAPSAMYSYVDWKLSANNNWFSFVITHSKYTHVYNWQLLWFRNTTNTITTIILECKKNIKLQRPIDILKLWFHAVRILRHCQISVQFVVKSKKTTVYILQMIISFHGIISLRCRTDLTTACFNGERKHCEEICLSKSLKRFEICESYN